MFGVSTGKEVLTKKESADLEKIDTLISSNVQIDGNIKSTGTVRLDCKVTGDVEGNGIIIGETGSVTGNIDCSRIVISGSSVTGDISCNEITISGSVKGNVLCTDKLHLKNTGVLIGDVEVGKIVIDEGALFRGICKMTSEEDQLIPKKSVSVFTESSDEDLFSFDDEDDSKED
jgi:cytoskeletal protein CcmA (bactofilin family)